MKEHFSPQSFTCNDNLKIWLYKLIVECYEKKITICLDKEEIRSFQLNGESVLETAGKIEALNILRVVSLTLLFGNKSLMRHVGIPSKYLINWRTFC